MSSSREGTPDWLSSFQAPTHTAVTLSTDSESSGDVRPLGTNIIIEEEPSASETSQFVKNEDQNMLVDDNVEESTLFKNPKSKMKRKQLKVEDDTPLKREKIASQFKKEETDIINEEEPSASETPESPKNKDRHILVNESVEESTLFKTSKSKMTKKQLKVDDDTPLKKRKKAGHKKKEGDNDVDAAGEETFGKHVEAHLPNSTIWTLSSDSESCPDNISIKEVLLHREEASLRKTSRVPVKREDEDADLTDSGVKTLLNEDSIVEKPMKKKLQLEKTPATKASKTNTQRNLEGGGAKLEVEEEATVQKHMEPQASSSRVPLMLAEKVHLSKALVECDGESIDLSGDMGSVGRIVIADAPTGRHEMLLDLKGTIYKTTIVPCRTFCVVSFGQSEAKIEAVMNDFIQLKPQSNVYETETMVEGTLEGFSFDSEDENDKVAKVVAGQTAKEEGANGQTNSKFNGKTEKASGAAQKKKSQTAAGKPQKKGRRKAQVPKKGKTKK